MSESTHNQIEQLRIAETIAKWVRGIIYVEPDEQQQAVDYCRNEWPDAIIEHGYGETRRGIAHWVQITRNQCP